MSRSSEPHGEEEYTQAKIDTDLVVLDTERTAHARTSADCSDGLVEVTEQVIGYQRKKLPGGELVEIGELDLPPQKLVTRAVWYTLPEASAATPRCADLEGDDVLLGALHAAEHAAIGILPVFAMCDRWDIGGLSTNFHPETGWPTIFIYDGYPMGAGISEHGSTSRANTSPRRAITSSVVRAPPGVRRACSHRSAATGTNRSTRPARSGCWTCCCVYETTSVPTILGWIRHA